MISSTKRLRSDWCVQCSLEFDVQLQSSDIVERETAVAHMTLNIELPDALETALRARAHERGVSTSCYARQVLERDLIKTAAQPKPKQSALGLLAAYGPGPSAGEIDENRRDMFRGFAEEIS